MANFDACWQVLLQNEGGFTVDNGGPTQYGITQSTAARHGYIGPMQQLPLATARQIAIQEYWLPYSCDQLPGWAADQILDAAYNGGKPAQWAQQVAGVTVDGQIGPKTIAAISAMNPWQFVALFNALRLNYLASLNQPAYANGRMNRIANQLRQGGLQ